MITEPGHPLVIWLLIATSVALVAGITYVYTNRNTRLTWVFTILSVLTIALIKIIGMVDQELHQQFIGRYDEQQMPYVFSGPGWHQIIDAWHLWILPAIVVAIISFVIFYFLYQHKSVIAPTKPGVITPITPKASPTSVEKLSKFMAMDAIKHETQQTNEKLAEALLMNAAQEIKLSDLNMQLRELQQTLAETKKTMGEEVTTLQLELAAKIKENEYISQQIAERTQELIRAQEMFEKLLQMQQGGEDSA